MTKVFRIYWVGGGHTDYPIGRLASIQYLGGGPFENTANTIAKILQNDGRIGYYEHKNDLDPKEVILVGNVLRISVEEVKEDILFL